MPKSFRVYNDLHQAHTALFRASDKALKKHEGILTAHQVILFVLYNQDGLPISEIVKHSGMSKSRLTGLIDTLEVKGFIRRERGSQDARQQIIFINATGRAIIDRTKAWVNEINASLLKTFDKNEQSVIQRFLNEATAETVSMINKTI